MTNTYSKANALGAPLSLRTAKRNRRDANNKREINKIKNIGSSKVIPASRGASGDQGATGFKAGIDPSKLVGSLQRKPKPRGPKNSSAATMTKDKAPTKLQQLDKKLGGLKRTPKQQAKIDKDKRKVNVTAKPTLKILKTERSIHLKQVWTRMKALLKSGRQIVGECTSWLA
jgi:N-methylhydantoinase A/oxoprolinase/acetone carboxylase beta subunit